MSAWTHSMCGACWNARHPERPAVVRTAGGEERLRCCWCGVEHASGIFVRASVTETKCDGVTVEDLRGTGPHRPVPRSAPPPSAVAQLAKLRDADPSWLDAVLKEETK